MTGKVLKERGILAAQFGFFGGGNPLQKMKNLTGRIRAELEVSPDKLLPKLRESAVSPERDTRRASPVSTTCLVRHALE